MEIKGRVHCLFEQSGTFKNEFRKMGYEAFDYDIQNNFGQTDFQIDIFQQIRGGYDGQPSIFDTITKDDLIIAFFPCIYFCENNNLYFTGKHANLAKYNMEEKIKIIIERSDNRHYFYKVLLMMFAICERKGLRMIFENPYSSEHYLYNNFPTYTVIIDKNRTLRVLVTMLFTYLFTRFFILAEVYCFSFELSELIQNKLNWVTTFPCTLPKIKSQMKLRA